MCNLDDIRKMSYITSINSNPEKAICPKCNKSELAATDNSWRCKDEKCGAIVKKSQVNELIAIEKKLLSQTENIMKKYSLKISKEKIALMQELLIKYNYIEMIDMFEDFVCPTCNVGLCEKENDYECPECLKVYDSNDISDVINEKNKFNSVLKNILTLMNTSRLYPENDRQKFY